MPFWYWVAFPAVTMSLGWGLRGYIGGGPLGAMIPGAMVALVLALLLGRGREDAGWLAAVGAVGVGLGGQETYGQTVGYSIAAETMWFGLAGLALKGAVWGLGAGVLLGAALDRGRYTRRDWWIGLALLILGTAIGRVLVDEPKLLYFSNRLDRPREELWCGLLLGGLAMLAWVARRSRLPLWFACFGFIAGGLGFGLGGLVQSLGRQYANDWMRDWWKMMEFTFGALFGAGLGWCAWIWKDRASGDRLADQQIRPVLWVLAALAAGVAISESWTLRFDYTVLGVVLLAVAWESTAVAWQVAVTMTVCAFLVDLEAPWVVPAVGTALTAWWVWRRPSVWGALLGLTGLAVGDALVKATWKASASLAVQAKFVVLALAVWWLGRRLGFGQGLNKRVAFGD